MVNHDVVAFLLLILVAMLWFHIADPPEKFIKDEGNPSKGTYR